MIPKRCDPSLFEKDLSGQVIIVTGANSGCGLETSRQLTKQGAKVVLACRRAEAGEAAAKELGDHATFLRLDLASLKSVRDFVTAFKAKFDRLDALVNNAGIMAVPFGKTEDNFEMQFGCNHLAHFLLFLLVVPMLLDTADQTGKPSRFVALSSVAGVGMNGQPSQIFFDDMNFETTEYNQWKAYQQSKHANWLHAIGAAKKYDPKRLVSFGVHPGWVNSNLANHLMSEEARQALYAKNPMVISPVDGAQTTLHCLLADVEKLENGAFYSQTGPYADDEMKKGGWPLGVSNPNATQENAERLWDESVKMVGEG